MVAASTDPGDTARDMASGLRLNFLQMVHSVDAAAVSQATGVLTAVRQEHPIMHAAGFLLTPEGDVAGSVISSGPIGRFVPAEVMAKVAFEQTRRS